jgi:Ca2+-binding RTX toxin-like protein
LARVILTQPGEDIDIGGDVTVVGTRSPGEVITVLRGTIVLDPSFNAGGDTLRLPDDAAFFTIRLVGSTAILQGLGVTVTVPVGTAGMQVAFNDVTRTLLYDPVLAKVKLGDQIVTGIAANVTPSGGTATLIGTPGADVITGTGGDDIVDGLGGADWINGGAGNDTLRGDAGGDDLDGSFGSDQIYGGPDADRITDNEGTSTFIDGGTGNDWIAVNNLAGTSFQLLGGDGDDYFEVSIGATGTCLIDAGSGQDRLVLETNGISIAATLGSGRDELVLAESALLSRIFGKIFVTDFQAGAFGDTVEILRAVASAAITWDQSSNPFASGYLRLIDRDGSAVLQFDRDGLTSTLNGFRDVLIFTGVSAGSLTRENLEGFDPGATLQRTPTGVDLALEPHHGIAMLVWEQQAFA